MNLVNYRILIEQSLMTQIHECVNFMTLVDLISCFKLIVLMYIQLEISVLNSFLDSWLLYIIHIHIT